MGSQGHEEVTAHMGQNAPHGYVHLAVQHLTAIPDKCTKFKPSVADITPDNVLPYPELWGSAITRPCCVASILLQGHLVQVKLCSQISSNIVSFSSNKAQIHTDRSRISTKTPQLVPLLSKPENHYV